MVYNFVSEYKCVTCGPLVGGRVQTDTEVSYDSSLLAYLIAATHLFSAFTRTLVIMARRKNG